MNAWSAALAALLGPEPAARIEGVDAFWRRYQDLRRGDPLLSAVAVGGCVDRIGWAFAAGYESAVFRLIDGHDPALAGALCVTESGPPHPRNIEARWDGERLDGHKRYVTLGSRADVLYVLARSGEENGRPRLTLLCVQQGAPGLTLLPGKATPFVPEVPHAEVRFEGVSASPLIGDGWSDYVKPFRTVEDLHVHAAVLAYGVAALSRSHGDREAIELGLATLTTFRALAGEDPSDPTVHLALHGAMERTGPVFDALIDALSGDEKARVERDRRLFRVASTARQARRERAWSKLER
ncbi:MAG: acyl-CoA dehydrogenase family protein [Sandaracinaceae bacterium]